MTKAFPGIPRNHHMLVVDNNDVLQEQKYKAMINLHNRFDAVHLSLRRNFFFTNGEHHFSHRIMEFRTAEGVQFDSACLKVSGDCEQRSLFEFWDFNTTVLQSLSVDDVRTKVSEVPLVSPVFNDEVDISTILGEQSFVALNFVVALSMIYSNDVFQDRFSKMAVEKFQFQKHI